MLCCVFWPANACLRMCLHVRMVENDEKQWKMMKKVPFPFCTWEAHLRRMKKNEEKSLLVSDWEWLPKAGWHQKAGCSFGILLFFLLHEPLMRSVGYTSVEPSSLSVESCAREKYLVVYQRLVEIFSNLEHWTFFFIFLHAPYMSLMYAWWKRYFFHDFWMFSIIFDHTNACTSMRSLVEIHNNASPNLQIHLNLLYCRINAPGEQVGVYIWSSSTVTVTKRSKS